MCMKYNESVERMGDNMLQSYGEQKEGGEGKGREGRGGEKGRKERGKEEGFSQKLFHIF